MSDSQPQSSSPAALGFRMPAEWYLHEATWLCWPTNSETWPSCLPAVESTYREIISHLAEAERVHLLVNNGKEEDRVRRFLGSADPGAEPGTECLRIFQVPTVDVWIRDYGPTFLIRARNETTELGFVHWDFNAWGNKYQDLKRDSGVARRLRLRTAGFHPGIVLEGGSIDVNGSGMCLTTEQCLLNPNRNPQLSRKEIEEILRAFLGLSQVVWLGRGIAGDDTDGHVDDVARFVDAETVVCTVEKDPRDENYTTLQDNLRRLQETRNLDGHPLRIVELPMPDPIEGAGGRVPASYANFYIANHTVLVPTYGCRQDQEALSILQHLFPRHRVTGIDCRALVLGLGSIHCITQQQPHAGKAPENLR